MSDKDKNLSEAISQIEKQFGKGTVMKMGDREIIDVKLKKEALITESKIFWNQGDLRKESY